MSSRFRLGLLSTLLICAVHQPLQAHAGPAQAARSLRIGPVALVVRRTGLYRVTGSFLLAHGIDWTGLVGRDLALLSSGQALARAVSTEGALDDRAFLDFYGTAGASRYSGERIYYLEVDPARAVPVPAVFAPPRGAAPLESYESSFSPARRTRYEPLAPGDGWFLEQLASTGSRTERRHLLRLPGLVARGTARLKVRVWGVTHLDGPAPQHHLQVLIDSRLIAEVRFSGSRYWTVRASFPAALLDNTSNALQLVLPGDVRNQFNVDIVDVESFTVTYPRSPRASADRFVGWLPSDSAVDLSGFHTRDIQVWSVRGGSPSRLSGATVRTTHDSYHALFSTVATARYLVADAQGVLQPAAVRAVPSTAYLERGKARLLVIGPPGMLSAAVPLIAYHRAHGMTVKTATVSDIYTRYGDGIPDPAAIRTYISLARSRLGVQQVLILGGDTYDYHGFLHCSSRSCPANAHDISIVPSPYVRDANFGLIPSDEWYVDSAQGPTVAIGRIPAVTAGQLRVLVAKTVQFLRHARSNKRAVFAAHTQDPEVQTAFQTGSETLAGLLPASYRVDRAYAGGDVSQARRLLLQDIDSGATLVNYMGHGNLEQWGEPPPMLSVSDVARFKNEKAPGIFLGWGCQTSYHVDPTDRSLNASLLFSTHGGAFLTLGSTGLDAPDPQTILARGFFTELFHDASVQTVGDALRQSEAHALASDASTRPVVQSYELFGDPALPAGLLRGN